MHPYPNQDREPRRGVLRIRSALRYALDLVLDLGDRLRGRRPELTPPRRLRRVGQGDFFAAGEDFLEIFRSSCGLRPDERILDVGCGIGRIAIPLTRYLDTAGSYDGFDVVPRSIRWCQEEIGARFENFRFHQAPLHHVVYNRRGSEDAVDYRFPVPSHSIDFAFLISVFTHLPDPAVEHYLDELYRVLRPGGRLLTTWFLLNPESEGLMADGHGHRRFPHHFGRYRASRSDLPEAAIAYPEDYVRGAFAERGLSIREPIRYGFWCGRSDCLSYQDVVIANRSLGVCALDD